MSMVSTGASAVDVVSLLQPLPQESADRLPSSLAG
jgi:1-acyl-sn-glycerol-3-phosphate acyltransferase